MSFVSPSHAQQADSYDPNTQLTAKIDEIIGTFETQWAVEDFRFAGQDQNLDAHKTLLVNSCNDNMTKLFTQEPNHQRTFDIDFIARVPKGPRSRLIAGSTDQHEFYRTIERYHVTAKIYIPGPCAITPPTCISQVHDIDGTQISHLSSCAAKPAWNFAQNKLIEKMPDTNEFISVSNWSPGPVAVNQTAQSRPISAPAEVPAGTADQAAKN